MSFFYQAVTRRSRQSTSALWSRSFRAPTVSSQDDTDVDDVFFAPQPLTTTLSQQHHEDGDPVDGTKGWVTKIQTHPKFTKFQIDIKGLLEWDSWHNITYIHGATNAQQQWRVGQGSKYVADYYGEKSKGQLRQATTTATLEQPSSRSNNAFYAVPRRMAREW